MKENGKKSDKKDEGQKNQIDEDMEELIEAREDYEEFKYSLKES